MYNRYCFFQNVNIDRTEILIYRTKSSSTDLNDQKDSTYDRNRYQNDRDVYRLFS